MQPKLDLRQTRRYATCVFETKEEMLKHIKQFGFKDDDRLIILRKRKKWIVWLDR